MIKSYNVYDMIASIFIDPKFSNHKKKIKSSILSSVILSSLSSFKSAGKPPKKLVVKVQPGFGMFR